MLLAPARRRYKSVILKEPLGLAGIQAVLDFANKGPRDTRVFEFESLGGAVARVPRDATAAANLRQASTVLVLKADSKDKEEANRALQDVSARCCCFQCSRARWRPCCGLSLPQHPVPPALPARPPALCAGDSTSGAAHRGGAPVPRVPQLPGHRRTGRLHLVARSVLRARRRRPAVRRSQVRP